MMTSLDWIALTHFAMLTLLWAWMFKPQPEPRRIVVDRMALVAIVEKLLSDAACVKARALLSLKSASFRGESADFVARCNAALEASGCVIRVLSGELVQIVTVFELLLALDTHRDPRCYWQMHGGALIGAVDLQYQVEARDVLGVFFAWLSMVDACGQGAPKPAPVYTCWNLLDLWRDDIDLLDAIALVFVWRRACWSAPAEAAVVGEHVLPDCDLGDARLVHLVERVRALACAEEQKKGAVNNKAALRALLGALDEFAASREAELLALDDCAHALTFQATNAMIEFARSCRDQA